MAVDDLIAEVIRTVEDLGLIDSTYFMYSSDHGFQLGQFNIMMDKRLVYEWDTKIHLFVRGPGVKPGSTFASPGTQVGCSFMLAIVLFCSSRFPSCFGQFFIPFGKCVVYLLAGATYLERTW